MVEEIQLLNPENGQIKAVKYTKGMQFVAPWIPIQIRQLTGAKDEMEMIKGTLSGVSRYLTNFWPNLYNDYDALSERMNVMGSPAEITNFMAELSLFSNFAISFVSPSEVIVSYDTKAGVGQGPYSTKKI